MDLFVDAHGLLALAGRIFENSLFDQHIPWHCYNLHACISFFNFNKFPIWNKSILIGVYIPKSSESHIYVSLQWSSDCPNKF